MVRPSGRTQGGGGLMKTFTGRKAEKLIQSCSDVNNSKTHVDYVNTGINHSIVKEEKRGAITHANY